MMQMILPCHQAQIQTWIWMMLILLRMRMRKSNGSKKSSKKFKQANKILLRQDIDTMRVNAPSAPVRNLMRKRPSSESEVSAKRAKQTDIGGLKANWKPLVYGNKTPSTSAFHEVSTEIEFEEIAGGEFEQDVAKEVVDAERAGKSHKKEAHTSKVIVPYYLSLRLTFLEGGG
ncbi:hypothetical protein F5890DRAFT_120096 [Lentinula detonsa]|uniref:Uncharacterized protein n=1 Tax=Lentinula detonsa TaxID=2804962 RepID=A0AA38PMY4_9AGAR|nr:hypothetical protein F5890DRAFT_120096 [Lentinula detonsa]